MFDELKKLIKQAIYPNNEGAVTAGNLQGILLEMCDLTDDNKQDVLRDNVNIKTINKQSILGSGNIDLPVDKKMSSTSTHPVQNKVVKAYIDALEDKNKGYYTSLDVLQEVYPNPRPGSRAYVGNQYPYDIYVYENDEWIMTGETGGDESVQLDNYYTKQEADDQFVTIEQIADYPTTDDLDDIFEGKFTIMSLDDYNSLLVKEEKLYFCTE